jgi:hypothetical protein
MSSCADVRQEVGDNVILRLSSNPLETFLQDLRIIYNYQDTTRRQMNMLPLLSPCNRHHDPPFIHRAIIVVPSETRCPTRRSGTRYTSESERESHS